MDARFAIVLTEKIKIEPFRLLKAILQIPRIILASHTKIRKVMYELTENIEAITSVGASVEDVLMPKKINVSGRNGVAAWA